MKTINEQLITAILLQEEAYDKIEKAEEVCNKEMIAFSLFCAKNYTPTLESNFWQNGFRKEYTTEELLTLYKDTL